MTETPRRHLMDEWPFDPLPMPVAGICNAEYVVYGVLVGHCARHIGRKGTHRGPHRIEWSETTERSSNE